jgi:uncharacterized damage-inducible protein DinB
MFTTIKHFETAWKQESGNTRKMLEALTDDSLEQSVADDHRTLGRMAWHITQSIPDMGNRTGLNVTGPSEKDPVPATADEIRKSYDEAASTLMSEVTGKWKDDTLKVEDDLFGETWKRGLTLRILIDHEIHHRGQMTVLMRQAGLKVPGLYGPSREEWANYGAPPPEI